MSLSWIYVPIPSLGSPHFVWASRLLSMIPIVTPAFYLHRLVQRSNKMAHASSLPTTLFKYYANDIFPSAKTHTEDSFSEVKWPPSSVWQLPLYPTAVARSTCLSEQHPEESRNNSVYRQSLQPTSCTGETRRYPTNQQAPGPTWILSRLRPPGAPENKLRSFLQFGEGTPSSDQHNPLPQAKSRSSQSRLP